jgi:lipopolysaccharide export LptBFGC system permease protein LptF
MCVPASDVNFRFGHKIFLLPFSLLPFSPIHILIFFFILQATPAFTNKRYALLLRIAEKAIILRAKKRYAVGDANEQKAPDGQKATDEQKTTNQGVIEKKKVENGEKHVAKAIVRVEKPQTMALRKQRVSRINKKKLERKKKREDFNALALFRAKLALEIQRKQYEQLKKKKGKKLVGKPELFPLDLRKGAKPRPLQLIKPGMKSGRKSGMKSGMKGMKGTRGRQRGSVSEILKRKKENTSETPNKKARIV